MSVQELIDELLKIKDKSQQIVDDHKNTIVSIKEAYPFVILK